MGFDDLAQRMRKRHGVSPVLLADLARPAGTMKTAWVLCSILAACGPTNLSGDTPCPAEAPRPASAPVSVTLPPEVASIMEPRSLAGHRRRAWIARYGPIRFAPTEPIAEETANLNARADDFDEPEIVVDVTTDQARIVTGLQGLRILILVAFDDLVSVPIRTVALRASAKAPEPPDDASAVRVYPGFRFTSVARRGDVFKVHYQGLFAQFHGFLSPDAFGVVFEPREAEVPPGETTSRARSSSTIFDRPNGQVIATLRGADPPYFEHDVIVLGEPRRGFSPIVLVSPSPDGRPVVARYLIRGWVRSRDLGLEPMDPSYVGSGVSSRSQHRERRVTIAAGTPLRRVPSGPIIGVAVESGTHWADPAPRGGYWVDVLTPWGALRVYVSEARES